RIACGNAAPLLQLVDAPLDDRAPPISRYTVASTCWPPWPAAAPPSLIAPWWNRLRDGGSRRLSMGALQPLSAVTRLGRRRGRPRLPGRSTPVTSQDRSQLRAVVPSCRRAVVPSCRRPAVSTILSRRPLPSQARCTFVVKPPPRRLGASSCDCA